MRTLRLVVLATLALSAVPAAADKADREKEINVGADQLLADDKSRTSVFEGNVVLTQGTMRITAQKVTVREDAERYKFYVANGAPVTFRQRSSDKTDEYVEGWAGRAEFDDKAAKLRLYENARVKTAQGEMTGDMITYDTNTERAEVGGAGAKPSRVKMTLIPQKKNADGAKPPAPLQLKPDKSPAIN